MSTQPKPFWMCQCIKNNQKLQLNSDSWKKKFKKIQFPFFMQRLKLNTGFFSNKRYLNDIFQVHWRAALLYQKHHHVNLSVVSNWAWQTGSGAKNTPEFCHWNTSWGSKTPKSKITPGTPSTAVTWNKPPGVSEQPPSSAAGRNWDPQNSCSEFSTGFSWGAGEDSVDFCSPFLYPRPTQCINLNAPWI